MFMPYCDSVFGVRSIPDIEHSLIVVRLEAPLTPCCPQETPFTAGSSRGACSGSRAISNSCMCHLCMSPLMTTRWVGGCSAPPRSRRPAVAAAISVERAS